MNNCYSFSCYCCFIVIFCALCLSYEVKEDGTLIYPHLEDKQMLCGRDSWKTISVCDPDKILGLKDVEASQLDEIIKKIKHETKCPCSNYICTKDPGGYKVGVAIVKKLSDDDLASSLDDEDHYEQNSNRRKKNEKKLEEAGKFAHMVRNLWKLGRCDEDIIIVYSHDDKVIYTVTGDMASKVLTNKLITEITGKVVPYGFNKGAFHGLNSILHDYRQLLQIQL
ncbi:hypothetical protein HELRODRAFT_159093 [Helobdella robusta]|uniref:TPM domain-containing protein n=1 Tax=Helobdella robusta TaxID=6412 RepID=T1ENK8_HELRO|nr:hypothetical protein HELRODRAFT_159093 [Helobdella robusta]ESO12537.1 hypothetical protein HELRODRAFT_159093 [Helobdella robusta]